MLNWYSFVKSPPNFIIFGWDWEEDILNIACKLISTILCDWHYLVVCQHNSWASFILRQHRKRTILFLQGSVETRNRCCGQYMHCFVGNQFRCKSAKNYKIQLRFHKAYTFWFYRKELKGLVSAGRNTPKSLVTFRASLPMNEIQASYLESPTLTLLLRSDVVRDYTFSSSFVVAANSWLIHRTLKSNPSPPPQLMLIIWCHRRLFVHEWLRKCHCE